MKRNYQTYKDYSITSYKKHEKAKNWRADIQDKNGVSIMGKKALSETIAIKMAKHYIDTFLTNQ